MPPRPACPACLSPSKRHASTELRLKRLACCSKRHQDEQPFLAGTTGLHVAAKPLTCPRRSLHTSRSCTAASSPAGASGAATSLCAVQPHAAASSRAPALGQKSRRWHGCTSATVGNIAVVQPRSVHPSLLEWQRMGVWQGAVRAGIGRPEGRAALSAVAWACSTPGSATVCMCTAWAHRLRHPGAHASPAGAARPPAQHARHDVNSRSEAARCWQPWPFPAPGWRMVGGADPQGQRHLTCACTSSCLSQAKAAGQSSVSCSTACTASADQWNARVVLLPPGSATGHWRAPLVSCWCGCACAAAWRAACQACQVGQL